MLRMLLRTSKSFAVGVSWVNKTITWVQHKTGVNAIKLNFMLPAATVTERQLYSKKS